MKKRLVKRIFLYTISIVLFLIVVLGIHIYIVTRPKAPDATTKIMARIDIKQPIAPEDAIKITTWMYRQKGIDHVLYNPESEIVVFTFFPISTSADRIVSDFKTNFHYKAERIVATEADLKNGCPVAAGSATYKVYNFFKHIF